MKYLAELLRRNRLVCFLTLTLIAIVAVGCRQVPKTSTSRFFVPNGSEGAFVVILDEEGGVSPETDGTHLDFVFDKNGLLKTNVDLDKLAGLPEFYYEEGAGGRIRLEYLTNRPQNSEGSLRSVGSLTEEERNNRVFIMNYEKGVLNSNSHQVRYHSFIICKPKDLNLVASRNLNEKLAKIQRGSR